MTEGEIDEDRSKKIYTVKNSDPGAESDRITKKKEQNVPRGPFNTLSTFAAKGEGALLTDVDGNTFIDLAGAIGSLNVGHCPPKVVEAIKAQVEQYIHPCFHVMMYEPYIQLAEN